MTLNLDAMGDGACERTMHSFVAAQAIKEVGQPGFSAPTVWFFASEEAGFISGQSLVVDGGAAKH